MYYKLCSENITLTKTVKFIILLKHNQKSTI